MPRDLLVLTACLALGAGCGGPATEPVEPPEVRDEPEPEPEPQPEPEPVAEESLPRGFPTVEELGETFVDAVMHADVKKIRACFPPEQIVLSALDCPGPGPNPILGELVEEMDEFIAELPELLKEVKVTWLGLVPRAEKEKRFEVGEDLDGCTVLKPVTVKEVGAKLLVTESGHTEEDVEDVTVIKFGEDGMWYIGEL